MACRALGLAALIAAIGGCSVAIPPPRARVRRGPAFEKRPVKILALPTVCETPDDLCNPGHGRALDMVARMALEFAGYRLIDSERLNVYLGQRTIRTTASSWGAKSRQVTREGVRWADATAKERAFLIDELGIDGMMRTAIRVGEVKNLDGQRTIEVHVTIERVRDGALSWSSRCAVETGRYHGLDQAVDIASHCALESAIRVGI